MARSLNKVTLIGNLTRDPELRYTPQGSAVCTFGLATNRQWMTDSGEKKEDVEFHRLVAWNKLAEICTQLLKKGRKVFVEGRLQTRNWTAADGSPRTTTEIVISDMILLDSRREEGEISEFDVPESAVEEPKDLAEEIGSQDEQVAQPSPETPAKTKAAKAKGKSKKTDESKDEEKEEVSEEDIPF